MTNSPTSSVKPGCEACSTGYHERCRDRRFARVLDSTTMLGCQPTASYCCCQDVDPAHLGCDTWPLISRPGTIWCRTHQVHFGALAVAS